MSEPNPQPETITVHLTTEEMNVLIQGLDSHVRHNGLSVALNVAIVHRKLQAAVVSQKQPPSHVSDKDSESSTPDKDPDGKSDS